MMKQITASILLTAFSFCAFSSCSWMMEPKEQERVPQPPPGPERRLLPHNTTQRFEAEATLGPLANPRR